MAKKNSPIRQLLSPSKIFIPIGLGLLVAGWLLYTEFDLESFVQVEWGLNTVFWIFMSLVMVATRDFGYMYRIRHLTDKAISWRNSFDVIMLWEFSSAISPSVVGGSGVAVFIVNKEGVKLGKSTAVVMVTGVLGRAFLHSHGSNRICLCSAIRFIPSRSPRLFRRCCQCRDNLLFGLWFYS